MEGGDRKTSSSMRNMSTCIARARTKIEEKRLVATGMMLYYEVATSLGCCYVEYLCAEWLY
jgi:hypothetical protein